MREAVPSLKASWDLLELEAARQPDSDYLLDHRGTHPLPASLDHRALSEPDAPEQRARNRTGRSAQNPGGPETLVTVHIMETTTAENPSGVATGS